MFLIFSRKFEFLIFFYFMYTILSGALRKWMFVSDSSGNFILFIQLLLPFFFTLNFQRLVYLFKNNLFKFYFLYLLFSAFHPLNLTIFHGIFGFILHLGFWWFLVIYYENRSYINVRPLIPYFVLFCLIELFLGFFQYQLSPDHILNKYANIRHLGENQSVALVGSAVRVSGTFSYISGFSSFLLFLVFFIWSLIRANFNKRVISILFSCTLIATLMSGSRNSVYLSILLFFLMIISEFTKDTLRDFLKSLIIPFSLLFLFYLSKGSFGFENTVNTAFNNFQERRTFNAQSGEEKRRIFGDFQEVFFDFRGNHPIFGVGLGATYQGATSIFGVSDYVLEYGYYESELPRIVLEGGFILLFFRICLFLWLLSWLDLNRLSKIILFFVFVFGISTVFNIYSSIFLGLGLIFLDNISYHNRTTYTFLNFEKKNL